VPVDPPPTAGRQSRCSATTTDGSPGALTSALLLCTDRRWHRCTARLVAGIVEPSVLGEDELDELAYLFLGSHTVRLQYPVSWIGTEWVSIDLSGEDEAADESIEHLDPATPVTSNRAIAPPLRRWAAARMLRSDPATFRALRGRPRARSIRWQRGCVGHAGRDRGARRRCRAGSDRPRARLAPCFGEGSALDLLAARDPEAARDRAATDPDKNVRDRTPRRPGRSPELVSATHGPA